MDPATQGQRVPPTAGTNDATMTSVASAAQHQPPAAQAVPVEVQLEVLRQQVQHLALQNQILQGPKVDRKLQPFDGKSGSDYSIWRADLLMAITDHNWDAKTVKAKVVEALRGDARTMLILGEIDAQSPRDWMKALDGLFQARNQQLLKDKVRCMRQHVSEPVEEYKLRVKAAFVALYGANHTRESDAIRVFAEGLQDRKIAARIIGQSKYHTLELAAAKAHRVITQSQELKRLMASSDGRGEASVFPMEKRASDRQQKARIRCHFCEKLGHIKKDCRLRKQQEATRSKGRCPKATP